MGLLLDIGYLAASLLTLPWLIYRMVVRGDWRGLPFRLGFGLGEPLAASIWLHGSSAGEIALLEPLVERLERDLPGAPLLISAYSSTGFTAARKAYPRHRVVFFPLDLSGIVNRFLRRFDPRLVVIVESEFWPNFLLATQQRAIPVAVINGKMSERSCRIHRRTRIVPSLLRRISIIAVQSQEHASRLHRLGVPAPRVRVTGNMKYDTARPLGRPEEAAELRDALGYDRRNVVIIGGSLHDREDDVLIDAFHTLAQRHSTALILVPRYPADAGRIEQSIRDRGYEAVRKTDVDRGAKRPPGANGVLVVDTVGELRALYAAADIAFVGGSLFYRGSNKGGHNLMEPAVLGLPVLFGPYNFSFKDTAEDLLEAQAGLLIHDGVELEKKLEHLLSDQDARRRMGDRARKVVLSGQGASQRNYELITPLLRVPGECLRVSPIKRTMPRAASDADSR
jgi:3-deoxy-D-manno-octulosonic-acid transferase